jgi:hypothetical protein
MCNEDTYGNSQYTSTRYQSDNWSTGTKIKETFRNNFCKNENLHY